MGAGAVQEDARYWAFISYSHKDATFGRRLHRRLENYSLPNRLVGRLTQRGPVPRRLAPIFRDREELSAASDLSAEVQAALLTSRSLIVVCSPAAAASLWVAKEVNLFRSLHPGGPILAAMAEGEPATSFPDALCCVAPDGARIEPLAADFRSHRDGRELGLLKLVAGIVGIGLNELVQRDAQRKARRVTAITAAALVAVLTMGALTIFATSARTEAVRQREEAEGLVQFMLTDLRKKLKGVGRLDIMGAVNARALHYYADEDLKSLPVESLERRARILHAMGEDDETRGDLKSALAKFHEAQRTTATLLAQAPNDAERIFDEAQSEFWIGSVAYDLKRFDSARQAFEKYKSYADRLVSLAPDNPSYRREAGFAESNLCTVALEKPRNPAAAVQHCTQALHDIQDAAKGLRADPTIVDDLVNRHAWLADSYLVQGDITRARSERLEEQRLLQRQIAADPKNMDHKSDWVALQIALARLEETDHRNAAARARLERALGVLETMIAFDPANKRWRAQRDWVRDKISKIQQ